MAAPAHRRLGAIQRALEPVNRRPRPAMSSSDVGSGPPKLLTDTQVKDFIKDGMLLLPIEELPTSFHEGIYHKCAETWARAADEPRDAGLAGTCSGASCSSGCRSSRRSSTRPRSAAPSPPS